MPTVTVEKALISACRTGAIHTMMESTAFSQDVYAKVAGITVGYPYEAFRDGVVGPLAQDPIRFFYAILNNGDLRVAQSRRNSTERPL